MVLATVELPKSSVFKNLTGMRFGRLVVVGYAGRKKATSWFCKCDCGASRQVNSSNLIRGHTVSCGCAKGGKVEHGDAKKGQQSQLYRLWCDIKNRVFNKNSDAWQHYGGRGVEMHQDWVLSYPAFRDWVIENLGNKPSPDHSIDRIDNNGAYEPGNVRWSTQAEQMNNTRKTRFIGDLKASEFLEANGNAVSRRIFYQRLDRDGWCAMCAAGVPMGGTCKHKGINNGR